MQNNPIEFSNKNRSARLDAVASVTYDLVVIGGGITGAGIALDGALRGLTVLLVEKNDFASGTSSKSTKLIHGGLRYLKQLEFGLVRESGLERAVAHNNAPHLVHPENMLLPIVENGTFSAFAAGLAISVYDRLANVEKKDRRKKLSYSKVSEMEPLLKRDILKSGILYSEYRTDDARLTIELIKAAVRNGAEAFNYLEATDFIYSDDKVCGVMCKDEHTSHTLNVRAKTVVNAAGPWVDKLRIIENEATKTNLSLSKGVHIVLDKKSLNIENSIYFDAFDGRMIFAIPRGQVVYVGTTDTFYNGDLDQLECTYEDATYLLQAVQNMFDIPSLTISDIKSSWSGLRPLIKMEGKGPTELSRKDEIFLSESGLISIAGGKLTGFRKMAERIVDLVFKEQGRNFIPCKTKDYKIHNNPIANYKAYSSLLSECISRFKNILPHDIEFLLNTYGKDALPLLDTEDMESDGMLYAQLNYVVNYEAVLYPLDFIERRTGWLYFDIDKAEKYMHKIVSFFAETFSRDAKWIAEQVAVCTAAIDKSGVAGLKPGLKKL